MAGYDEEMEDSAVVVGHVAAVGGGAAAVDDDDCGPAVHVHRRKSRRLNHRRREWTVAVDGDYDGPFRCRPAHQRPPSSSAHAWPADVLLQ